MLKKSTIAYQEFILEKIKEAVSRVLQTVKTSALRVKFATIGNKAHILLIFEVNIIRILWDKAFLAV